MYSTVCVWPIAVRTLRLKNAFRMGHIVLIIIEEFDRNGRIRTKIKENFMGNNLKSTMHMDSCVAHTKQNSKYLKMTCYHAKILYISLSLDRLR